MTSLPTWAVYTVAFGTPVASLLGVIWAAHLGRRGTKELERRSKREETLRTLRWAAELAVSDRDDQKRLGVAQLYALEDSKLLDADEQGFIDAAFEATYNERVQEMELTGLPLDDVDVVLSDEPDADPGVPSEDGADEGSPADGQG